MLKLALRNIFRHRIRSLISIGAIAGGCFAVIFIGGYFEDTFLKMRESYIYAHTGHIQIYKKGFNANRQGNPFGFLIDTPQEVGHLISQIPGVLTISQRLEFSGILKNGDGVGMCIGQGVEVVQERSLLLNKENLISF